MQHNIMIIDGKRFDSFHSFIDYMNSMAFTSEKWHGNLDALNDFLSGGFGNDIEGKSIKITNSKYAKVALGREETRNWLQERIKNCHPSNKLHFQNELNLLETENPILLWDKIIEIFKSHACNYNNNRLLEIPELVID